MRGETCLGGELVGSVKVRLGLFNEFVIRCLQLENLH